jgi:hypothetical protein
MLLYVIFLGFSFRASDLWRQGSVFDCKAGDRESNGISYICSWLLKKIIIFIDTPVIFILFSRIYLLQFISVELSSLCIYLTLLFPSNPFELETPVREFWPGMIHVHYQDDDRGRTHLLKRQSTRRYIPESCNI